MDATNRTPHRTAPGLAGLLLALPALGLAACAGGNDAAPAPAGPGEQLRSSLSRATSPAVAPADLAAQVEGNTAFALKLHRQLRKPGENLFHSPASVSGALAMLYGGARGATEAEMAAALEYRLPQASLHPAFNALDLALNSRGQGARGADGQPFRLRNLNAVFGQDGYDFLPAYLDLLAVNYGAGMSILDFAADPEGSRAKINAWVAGVTEDRIDELLAEGTITRDTVLTLVNAIYFNAAWARPFDEGRTADAPFQAPGGPVQVKMMRANGSFGHAATADHVAVSLPYDGDELDLLVVMPTGDLDAFEDGLDAARLGALFASLQPAELDLGLPRVEFRWKDSLVRHLEALGMVSAFGDADLSGIDGTRSLVVTEVVHEAFVKMDERGTEAAAATAVVIGKTSAPVYTPVTFDRPYFLAIRDRGTGSVVFAGRVVDPTLN